MPIEALIFDCFGVLARYDEEIFYRRVALDCPDPERTRRNLNGLLSSPDLICGSSHLADVHAAIVRDEGLSLSYDAFVGVWNTPYSTSMPGMLALLEELAARYRLVLLSNIDGYYWEAVGRHLPEVAPFAQRLLSFEMGLAKPDAAAFERAVVLPGAPPERCFFVDDRQTNIDAARALGIEGHLFTGAASLRLDLEKCDLI